MRVDHNKAFNTVEAIAAQTDFPVFLELLQLWQASLHEKGRPLIRDDLDFLGDQDWKPHITIVDIIRNGSDARFRLMGRSHVEGLGRNATGECLSSLPHCVLKASYKPVIQHITHKASPLYLGPVPIVLSPRKSHVIEQLHLPLNILEGRPHMILSAIHLVQPMLKEEMVQDPTEAA